MIMVINKDGDNYLDMCLDLSSQGEAVEEDLLLHLTCQVDLLLLLALFPFLALLALLILLVLLPLLSSFPSFPFLPSLPLLSF